MCVCACLWVVLVVHLNVCSICLLPLCSANLSAVPFELTCVLSDVCTCSTSVCTHFCVHALCVWSTDHVRCTCACTTNYHCGPPGVCVCVHVCMRACVRVCTCVCVLVCLHFSSGGVHFCSATYRLFKVGPSELSRDTDTVVEVQYKGGWEGEGEGRGRGGGRKGGRSKVKVEGM